MQEVESVHNKIPFFVLDSENIGQVILSDIFKELKINTNIKQNTFCILPSINHGRSVAIFVDKYKWILIKGAGWNYGGPLVYKCKKDSELIFGLCGKKDALREIAVSKKISEFSDEFPIVFDYKLLRDYLKSDEYSFLDNLRYADGNLIEPVLLFTSVCCPYRVADLCFFTDKEKEDIINNFVLPFFHISRKEYISKFAYLLGKRTAILHSHDFLNDTLEYSNVTLLAEIIDYELFTVPNIPFLDGSLGLELKDERREKEILYGAEIVLKLSYLLHEGINLFECYKLFLKGYMEINPRFIEENKSIKEIEEGKKFVL